jgi:hypothetical protein
MNTIHYLEEWRGEQIIPPQGDNFTPMGQNSLLGDNFAPGGQSLPLGASGTSPSSAMRNVSKILANCR